MISTRTRQLHQLRSLEKQIIKERGEYASLRKIVSECLSKHISIMEIFWLDCLNSHGIRKLH